MDALFYMMGSVKGVGRPAGIQARAEEMMSRHGFLGVPLATFEQAGRGRLIALLPKG